MTTMTRLHNPTRRLLVKTLGVSALAAGGAFAASDVPPARPNIIHIMADDHAFQAISAYGHPVSRLAPTPNIDRIAREGMVFRRAFVENSLCSPSRACLFTGLYSHQNGQRTLAGGLDNTKPFFTEALQRAGYYTGVIGKWHLPCEPKGFDYYCLLEGQGQYYNPGFKTKESNGAFVQENGYVTTLTGDHSIEFLKNRDKTRPFCLFVHHKAPHRNWMPKEKYLDLYENVEFLLPDNFFDDYKNRCEPARTQKMSVAADMTLVQDLKMDNEKGFSDAGNNGNIKAWNRQLSRLTPAQRTAWLEAYGPRNARFAAEKPEGRKLAEWKYQRYMRDYLRCIKSIDDQVGRLLDYLEKEGLRENTIIVYTSDQGFYLGEHGWFDKRFMYEESFRTPLIIAWPGRIVPGVVCDELVQNIDFAPTYLEAARAEPPAGLPGRSLSPLFAGGKPVDWREYLYYHYYEYPGAHYVCKHDGVRDKRYKYIHFYGKSRDSENLNCGELYDLEKDPAEMTNLTGRPEYAEVRKRMLRALADFREKLNIDEY